MKKKYAAAIAYSHGHEDGYETGYEHGRQACRMTDDARRWLVSAMDTLRDGGVTMDQIVLEVLDYARKTDTDKR